MKRLKYFLVYLPTNPGIYLPTTPILQSISRLLCRLYSRYFRRYWGSREISAVYCTAHDAPLGNIFFFLDRAWSPVLKNGWRCLFMGEQTVGKRYTSRVKKVFWRIVRRTKMNKGKLEAFEDSPISHVKVTTFNHEHPPTTSFYYLYTPR